MTRVNTVPTWSTEVVRTEVRGNPCLAFDDRPRRLAEVVLASRRWSNREFLVQGKRRLTFTEHETSVGRAAAALRARSIRPGDRVAIFAANSPEWVTWFFAITWIGAVAVPCNGWWSRDELAHACSVVEPRLVLVDPRRAPLVPEGVPVLNVSVLDETGPGAVKETGVAAPAEVDEDAPALILFTSGTTGRPKGAILSHRALCANLQNLLVVSRRLPRQLAPDHPPSITLICLPLFHIGAIQLALVPLVTGSKLIFLSGRFDPAAVADLIDDEHVTMLSAVPTMMERLLAVAAERGRGTSTLRTIVLGGASVSADLIGRVAAVYPEARRGIGKSYGLTEACGVVSSGVAASMGEHPDSVGRLMPCVEVDCGGPDGAGPGELLVRAPTVMHGYWGEPPESTITADGWLRTGDLGRIEDEHLYLTGRLKDIIIRGGENIAPARVEERLLQHPGVAEAAVLGLPHPDLGEEVAAVIVPACEAPGIDELREHCAAQLGTFQVPSRWWIRDEPLPTNAAGKVVKTQLIKAWPADARGPL